MIMICKEVRILFVLPISVTREKIAAILAIVLFVCATTIYITGKFFSRVDNIPTGTLTEDTPKGHSEYLKALGYETDGVIVSSENISIPFEFDDVWNNYETLQKQAGFSLEKYKGKNAIRYTYCILNHDRSDEMKVYANIVVLDKKVIAGDIFNPAFRTGFMEPLLPKKSAAKQ